MRSLDTARVYDISLMAGWEARCSVRHAHAELASEGTLPFTPELFPVVEHPLVVQKGPDAVLSLLAYRLFGYQDFTYALELDVIAKVANRMARGHSELGSERAIIEDAQCIGIDEAAHARAAFATKWQVASDLRMTLPIAPPLPAFLHSLHAELAKTPAEQRSTVELVFTVVSETLITSTLATIPNDRRVLPIVRRTVMEHARDEALHHRVFARALEVLWNNWGMPERDRYGPLFAKFMAAFLMPDFGAIVRWLGCIGISETEAKNIIADTYPRSKLLQTVRDGARASLNVMDRAGVLAHRRAQDEFSARGLFLAA